MIRVLVVEDHGVVRAGLEQLIGAATDLELVGSAAGGREGVTLATEHRPDVVLMDLSMPDMSGVEATKAIRAAAPGVRVVVLTSFSDRERIMEAIDAGAIGYLLKDADPDELFGGIRAAAQGESPLATKAASALVAARADRAAPPQLTERERQVLELLGEGHANKAIARRLEISEKTVKNHVTSILQSLDVTDRTQAALWARAHGFGDRSA